LPETQVILTDARDLDPGERKALAGSAVRHVPDVRALLELPQDDRPVHIHFDVDLVSPNDAPAMNYRTPGGPSAAEVEALFRGWAQSGRIAAVSMAAWNPKLDTDGRSQAVCLRLLETLIA
jgi:arginase